MKELKLFLERMGGLHDAVVRRLIWAPEAKTLRLEIEDLCSNFEGLPEYPGAVPGAIELQGVERIDFDIDTDEKRLHIDEFLVEAESADKYLASISFWPGGRIILSYRVADFPEVKRV
ncbi:MAG: hypothetical protein LBM17_06355 [Candidatus Accumulibacter sp.]|jgi:hypothetical protein|nr:hypothetical protein [Accumulibacter sp.]